MNKVQLRSIYKSKRKKITSEEINEISLRILKNLQSMAIWQYSNYHIFMPISTHKEINTLPIIRFLFESQKQVMVPKIKNSKMLCCLINSDTEFEIGKFNVPEPKSYEVIDPKEIEVVFMPMLICDQNGNRVGYGGGFYDRFLLNCRRDVIKIGLNSFAPITRIDDVQQTDVPLNYCVTADEIVSFTS